jgi:hypothetical protein
MKESHKKHASTPTEAVFLFQETASGEVVVTLPDGTKSILDPDPADAYARERVLSEEISKKVAQRLRSETKQATSKTAPPPLSGEHLYTPQELARMVSLDISTIRRMFVDEPGVVRLGKSGRRDGKRDYVTLRIPKSVAERVLREKMTGR